VFAGALNKGIRGAMAPLIALFLIAGTFLFFAKENIEPYHYPNLFYNFFTAQIQSKWGVVLLNLIFCAISTFMISLMTGRQEIVEKLNYFPVFIFSLASLACVSPTQITSQAFTNVFIIYAIYKLIEIYRQDNALNEIYIAAFWLSVSAFITISSIISFPLFFIILLILRPFYWREWVVALLGFASPVILYESIAYLSDFTTGYFAKAGKMFYEHLKLPSFSEYYIPLSSILFILFVLSLLQGMISGFGNTVKKQRTKSILLWFIFLSLPGFFSGGSNASSIILTFAFPLSFFIGDFLYSLKQIKITNTILTILLLSTLLIFLAEFGII
jgi:hypothetical protein